MPDLDKVLAGLRACQYPKGGSSINCELQRCPYREYDPDFTCTTRLHQDAEKLISDSEMFVPVKSTEKQLKTAAELGIYCSEYWCGNCHMMLINRPKFCPNCGKKVLWDA